MIEQETIDRAVEEYAEEYGKMNSLVLTEIWEAILEGEDVPDEYAEKFIEPFLEILKRIIDEEQI